MGSIATLSVLKLQTEVRVLPLLPTDFSSPMIVITEQPMLSPERVCVLFKG